MLGFCGTMGVHSTSAKGVGDRQLCVVVRHGQTDWNKEGRVQGQIDDSRLLPRGEQQARTVGRLLRGIEFDGVFSSPLHRAKTTTQHILDEMQMSEEVPVQYLNELKEIHLPWEGMVKKEIRSVYEEYYDYHHRPEAFEINGVAPVKELHSRVSTAWDSISATNLPTVLVVSHNQTNRALLGNIMGLPISRHHGFSQDNCCFNVIQREGDRATLLWSNVGENGPNIPTEEPPKGMLRLELRCDSDDFAVLLDGSESAVSSSTPELILQEIQSSGAVHALVQGEPELLTSLCSTAMGIPHLSLQKGGVASVLISRDPTNDRANLETFRVSSSEIFQNRFTDHVRHLLSCGA